MTCNINVWQNLPPVLQNPLITPPTLVQFVSSGTWVADDGATPPNYSALSTVLPWTQLTYPGSGSYPDLTVTYQFLQGASNPPTLLFSSGTNVVCSNSVVPGTPTQFTTFPSFLPASLAPYCCPGAGVRSGVGAALSGLLMPLGVSCHSNNGGTGGGGMPTWLWVLLGLGALLLLAWILYAIFRPKTKTVVATVPAGPAVTLY